MAFKDYVVKKQRFNLRSLPFFIIIIAIFFLLLNANNDPTAFIDRVFRPINIANVTIQYSGVIVVFMLYMCVHEIYRFNGYAFLKTTGRRILAVLIIAILISYVILPATKFFKGFSGDLNSIYYDRNNSSLEYTIEGKDLIIEGRFNLENCSGKVQKFRIKVYDLDFARYSWQQISDEYAFEKEVELFPHEMNTVEVSANLKNSITGAQFDGGVTSFVEFSLFNDEQEVKFLRGEDWVLRGRR